MCCASAGFLVIVSSQYSIRNWSTDRHLVFFSWFSLLFRSIYRDFFCAHRFLSRTVLYRFQYPRRGDIFEGYRFPFHYSAQPLPRELSLTTVPNFERQSHSHTPTRGAFRNNAHKRSATSMSDLGGSFRGVVAAPAVSGNGSFTATAYVNLRMLPHGNDFEDLEVKVDGTPLLLHVVCCVWYFLAACRDHDASLLILKLLSLHAV